MAQPGCAIIFAPSQRIDRRASLRRSLSLNSKPKRIIVDSCPVTSSSRVRDPRFSHAHHRSLSDKMRALQSRMKRDHDTLAEKPQAAAAPPPVTRRNPRHLDLLEAASQKELENSRRPKNLGSAEGKHQDHGTGKENEALGTKRKAPSFAPFNGDQSYRQIAYDQYMSQAFGLATGEVPKPAAVQRLRMAEVPSRPDSDMSANTLDSMEVNFHMASKDIPQAPAPLTRDQRPKIQVTIPGKQTSSAMHLAHQMSRQKSKGRRRHTPLMVSPTSATTSQGNGEAPARLSIVSPLSVVEMPKPRRPFSAFSLEDMTNDMPRSAPLVGKSINSDSSDDADRDEKTSNYSPRSSISSLTSVTTMTKSTDDRRHSIAFSIMSPAAAGVFDSQPLVPNIPKDLRSMKSMASLTVNTNKPLPPEPGLEDVAPLRLPSHINSRENKMSGKRKAPTPLTISRSSTINVVPSRMSSLRSKYTPADLDALDAAFIKTSPISPNFYSQETSLEQAQLELEAHLGTITEDDSSNSGSIPLVHDPLQISRGPNEMVPSRQAPRPPSSTNIKLSDGSNSGRKRLQKKPSVHVALQMKAIPQRSSSELCKRISSQISAPIPEPMSVSVRGDSTKANKVLGKVDSATPMEREISSESNWSSSESPETSYADSSSPNTSSREDSSTPETDVSSIPDHAFEEVRARLELLSPKKGSPPAFGDRGSGVSEVPTTVHLPIQENNVGVIRTAASRPTSSDTNETTKDNNTPAIHLTSDEDSQSWEAEITFDPHDYSYEPLAHPRPRPSGQDSVRRRSLASIAMSEIPDMYADMPCDRSMRDSMSAEDVERMISADAAEKVLLRILQNLDNLQDLFATATVSRGFYRTFKRHELPLMKNALYGMSPAAWELREMCPPYPGLNDEDYAFPRLDYTPALYLQHYMRDMYTMIALKSMILIHCESFLRADTITALGGGETERASQIDDAFWRVWTFCQVFGCGSGREDDIVAQMDWLNGGVLAKRNMNSTKSKKNSMFGPITSLGHGNAGGLSAEDMYDMNEIWTCLGVLVRGFQGKRQEARDYGVFDNADITGGDVEAEDAVLEEWTYHLLTLAPPTVLDVTSPTTPTAASFAHARSRGFTSWTPPQVSRATFLKEAVSRVYQERMAAKYPGSVPTSPKANISDPTSPVAAQHTLTNEAIASRWRCARHAAEIRAKRSAPDFDKLPPSEDRPMSNYPDVLEKLDPSNAPPVPAIRTSHKKTLSESDTSKHMVSALVVPSGPQVRDPVDVAVEKLVGMGFEPKMAQKALAETDTGNSVDFDAALLWLVRERKRDVSALMHARYQGKIGEEREEVNVVTPLAEPGLGLGLGWT